MIRPPSHRILALARLELLTTVRDRAGYTMFLISFALGFLMAPASSWVAGLLASQQAGPVQVVQGTARPTCPEGTDLTISVEGPWPDWIAWPAPIVAPADDVPHVVVSAADDGFLRFLLEGDAASGVDACLFSAIAARREERLASLGLSHDPDRVLAVQEREVADAEDAASRLEHVSPLGSLLATLGLVVAGGVAIEAVPRRRASGLFEQLRSTQTRSLDLVVAWLLTLTALTTSHLVLASVAHLLSAWLFDVAPGPLLAGVHAPVLALQVAAASVRTSLHAVDVQSASMRWFGVIFAQLGFTGLAGWWMGDQPWLAALVPLGGSTLASAGLLGGWGVLADLAGIGWSALLALACARSLDGEDSSAAGADPTLTRRARDVWWPEALVLGAIALSTPVAASGAGDRLWLAMPLAFLVFLVAPALLAGPVLGLPMRELLSLRRPSAPTWAALLPVTVGLFCLGQLVVLASVAVMPDNALVRKFATDLAGFATTPSGALAVTLLPAVCEELLYRGALLGLLLRSGRPRLAIAGQAVAFALAHAVSIRLPWTFLLGALLGWLRVRTGSLWAGVAVHFLLNGSAVAVAWLGWAAPPVPWLVAGLVGLAALPLIPTGADGESRR